MEIKLFSLMNTSIVAKQISENENGYVITDARIIAPQPNGQVALIPFPVGAAPKQQITLRKDVLLTEPCNVDANLEKDYVRVTSGLVVANEGDLKQVQKRTPH